MSSTIRYAVLLAVLISAAAISCGGGDPETLATAEGFSVTVDSFREEFESLTPEGQVMVLEPGGRLDLVTRMINENLLLGEAVLSAPEDLDDWLMLSETAWLSSRWLEVRLDSMNAEGIDSLLVDSLLSIGITLEAVLMEDSTDAALLLDQWNRRSSFDPGEGMALAPWTLDGSSYIQLEGNMFSFLAGDPSFAAIAVPLAGEGYVQIPAFGAWVVCRMDTSPIDPSLFTLQSVAKQYVATQLAVGSLVTVMSAPVSELAAHLTVRDGMYVVEDIENLDQTSVIAAYPGGALTVGDVIDVFGMIHPYNFFGGIPQDLYPVAPPLPTIEPGIDLWMFTGNLATVYSQAERAREVGIVFPEDQVSLTTTEHMLRVIALLPAASVDSASAIEFYNANMEYYTLPELRSVVLAYVPTEWMGNDRIDGFDDLEQYYSSTDSLGQMIPTPPRAVQVFGPIGPAIFAAPEGAFQGPVQVEGTDLFAFFEVMEIIPEGTTGPEDLLPLLVNDCRISMISANLDEYFVELWSRYDVEIDSSAVVRVDPWATAY